MHVDQIWVWGLFCFLGMYLNVNLATAIVPHGTDLQGLAAGAYQAEYLAKIWPGFWFLTLFNGFWILFKTQLGNTDVLVRTTADALWMSHPRVHSGFGIRAVYYGILALFSVWGVVAIRSASPFQLFKVLANMAGLVLVIAGDPDPPRQPPLPAEGRAPAALARSGPARCCVGVLRVLRVVRPARRAARPAAVARTAATRSGTSRRGTTRGFLACSGPDSSVAGGRRGRFRRLRRRGRSLGGWAVRGDSASTSAIPAAHTPAWNMSRHTSYHSRASAWL